MGRARFLASELPVRRFPVSELLFSRVSGLYARSFLLGRMLPVVVIYYFYREGGLYCPADILALAPQLVPVWFAELCHFLVHWDFG